MACTAPPPSGPHKKPVDRTRAWVFTINNYSDEDVRRLECLDCERMVVGKEVCPTTGTPHLQGYVRFSQPRRFSWWKNQFPKAHVEARHRKATDAHNEAYCTKDGNVLINRGVNVNEDLVESRGKRTRDEEADEIIAEIEDGAKYGQIRSRHKRFFFWHRNRVREFMYDHKQLDRDADWDPGCPDR